MCDGSNCRNWVDNNTNRFTLLFFTLDHLVCQVGVGTCSIVYSEILPNNKNDWFDFLSLWLQLVLE